MNGPEPTGLSKKAAPWLSTSLAGRIDALNIARLFSIGVNGVSSRITIVRASTTRYSVIGRKKRPHCDFSPAARRSENSTSCAVTGSPFENFALARSLNSYSLPSGLTRHDSATPGSSRVPSRLGRTSWS